MYLSVRNSIQTRKQIVTLDMIICFIRCSKEHKVVFVLVFRKVRTNALHKRQTQGFSVLLFFTTHYFFVVSFFNSIYISLIPIHNISFVLPFFALAVVPNQLRISIVLISKSFAANFIFFLFSPLFLFVLTSQMSNIFVAVTLQSVQ